MRSLSTSRVFTRSRRSWRLATVCCAVVVVLLAASAAGFATERVEERSLAPGGQLRVDASSASIVVEGVSGLSSARIEFDGRPGWEEKFEITIDESPGQVSVVAKKRKSTSGFWGLFSGNTGSVRIRAQVPEETSLVLDTSGGSIEVENLTGEALLDTSGGHIKVRNVRGPVTADTSGGSIRVENVTGTVRTDTSGGSIHLARIDGDASADTSGGSIEATDIRGDVELDTSGGGIEASGISGFLQADTSGGSIEARFAEGASKGGHLETSGGNIRVQIDGSVGLTLDAASRGGKVHCELPVTVTGGEHSKSTLQGDLGGGGARLVLRTSGGSIYVDPL